MFLCLGAHLVSQIKNRNKNKTWCAHLHCSRWSSLSQRPLHGPFCRCRFRRCGGSRSGEESEGRKNRLLGVPKCARALRWDRRPNPNILGKHWTRWPLALLQVDKWSCSSLSACEKMNRKCLPTPALHRRCRIASQLFFASCFRREQRSWILGHPGRLLCRKIVPRR